ncbi:ABC transporter ATP-binding protein [Halanaeroarchaeum sulfurireducens]|uniref:ABC transporter ATP-binding protein n=1 Tax=Halanaeroarchaeum sulfurireducens TaxID=1604004 RepID=UPI0006794F41|nr:ABC transporter ATP-binding protein [Halanaeroarchaeum sulfurireducens]
MSSSRDLIAVENVSKRYESPDGIVAALEGVDLSVGAGDFVSMVGPSGGGKTTLLRLIAGLETPSSGTVLVDGEPVTGTGPDRGLVFQDATLFPWRTVAENVRFALEVDDTEPERARHRVEDLLSMVGLADRADSYPDELSGGMRKRVGIARALAPDPDILLLDEPFSDLDVATRETLQADLLEIWNRLGKTIVLVTHTVGEAVRLSDAVAIVRGQPGRIETVVDVDVGRPRRRGADGYGEYVREIRTSIRGDHSTDGIANKLDHRPN